MFAAAAPQPANIQAVVDNVTKAPLTELAAALQGFQWDFEKVCLCGSFMPRLHRSYRGLEFRRVPAARVLQGDFHHWVPVFNHFDAFFEEHIKPRSDLQLKVGPAKADPPFPVDNCLAVLRATAVLLEHCSNKQLYNSYEVSACSL